MSRIITIGEPLGQFVAVGNGDLRKVDTFKRYVSGVELSYATGMARLGHEVDMVTKVGNDPLGLRILDFFKEENINTEYLDIMDDRSTGVEMKSDNPDGWPELYYYRRETAASTLSKEDVRRVDFSRIDHMHITGIPIALSESCREAVMEMIYQAHQNDITVSFDPNLRPRLWQDEVEMKKILNGITILCDIVFPEIFEAQKLLGTADPDKIADFYISAGVKTVVIKMGDRGIFVKNKKERFWAEPYPYTKVVDLMGVGEGFAVGVTSALLEGRTLRHAIERGRIIGARIATSETSYLPLPRRDELISLIKNFYDYKELGDELLPGPLPDKAVTPEEISAKIEEVRQQVKEQVDPVQEKAADSLDAFLAEEKNKELQRKLRGTGRKVTKKKDEK